MSPRIIQSNYDVDLDLKGTRILECKFQLRLLMTVINRAAFQYCPRSYLPILLYQLCHVG